MRVHSLVLWGTVVLVAGCGDDTVPTIDGSADLSVVDLAGTVDMTIPDDLEVNVPASTFVQDKAKAICAHLMMCGELDPANLAACIEANTPQLGIDEDTEILLGRVHINELQCLAAIMNARCDGEDTGNVFFFKCAELLDKPMQPSDGVSACLFSGECVNGYCAHGTADAGTAPEGCPGTCTPFKAINAACVSDTECNSTVAFCDTGTKKCASLTAVNGDCTTVSCQSNLYCNANNKCTASSPSGMMGAACSPFQGISTDTPECADGFFCKLTAAPSPACAAKIASGGLCNTGDVFAKLDSQCVDGTTCFQTPGQANPTCQPWAAKTQPCDPVNPSCQATLYCDATNPAAPVCKSLIADGAACDPATNNHCLAGSGHFGQNCVGAAGSTTCVADKAFKAACTPGTDDAVCDTGYCSPSKSQCLNLCM